MCRLALSFTERPGTPPQHSGGTGSVRSTALNFRKKCPNGSCGMQISRSFVPVLRILFWKYLSLFSHKVCRNFLSRRCSLFTTSFSDRRFSLVSFIALHNEYKQFIQVLVHSFQQRQLPTC